VAPISLILLRINLQDAGLTLSARHCPTSHCGLHGFEPCTVYYAAQSRSVVTG